MYCERIFTFEKSKDKVIAEAQRQAKLLLREAKEVADVILKSMRELEELGITSE